MGPCNHFARHIRILKEKAVDSIAVGLTLPKLHLPRPMEYSSSLTLTGRETKNLF